MVSLAALDVGSASHLESDLLKDQSFTPTTTLSNVATRQKQPHSPYLSTRSPSLHRARPPVTGSIRELAKKQSGNNNTSRRKSLLGTGRDILKRQSLSSRGGHVSSATTTINPSAIQLNGTSNSRVHPVRHSLPVDSMALKKASATTLDAQPTPQLKIATALNAVDDAESICRSPTWGEERSRKSRSTWNWRKSSVPRLRAEDEIAEQSVKQGKKLNKKPPPAMETQGYGAALGDSVIITSGPALEKRRSSSGSLTQVMLGFLSRRSSRTMSPDGSRPPSALAIRSTSQGPKTMETWEQDAFDRTGKDEDDAYVNDLAEFGIQMEASVRASWGGHRSRSPRSLSARQTSFLIPPDTPPQSRGQEVAGDTVMPLRSSVPRSTSVPTTISRLFGKKDNAAGGYKYPEINKKLGKDEYTAPNNIHPNAWLRPSNNNMRTQSTTDVAAREPSFRGGYVQRQRTLNQQRSIARFNDEVAVKSAYDSFISEPQLPITPQDSSESVQSDTTLNSKIQPDTAMPLRADASPSRPEIKRQASQIQVAREVQLQAVCINGSAKTRPISSEALPQLTSQPSKAKSQQLSQEQVSAQKIHTEEKTIQASPLQSQQAVQKVKTAKISERKSFNPFSRSREGSRPAPVVIQPEEVMKSGDAITKSPDVVQDEVLRQSKDSTLTSSTSSTGVSTSSVLTRKISPTYQLPPLSSSPTSPIFGEFSGQTTPATSPPVLALSDSTVRLIPPVDYKTAPTIPLPLTPVITSKPELLIASENAEGIIRKTSVKRHRSDPELKVPEVKIDPPTQPPPPSFDFLPELKHQPLQKPKRSSQVVYAPGTPPAPRSPSQFPVPSNTEVSRRPGGGRMSKRTSYTAGSVAKGGPPKPVAKMFVICCHCKFWHDLPSKIYEAMALPQSVSKEDDIAVAPHDEKGGKDDSVPGGQVKGLEGKIFTQVKCPWCEHGMSTNCCQGWTAVIYLHERHH